MRFAVRLSFEEKKILETETDPDLIYLYTQHKKILARSKVTANRNIIFFLYWNVFL
jgi:hypothetical protein